MTQKHQTARRWFEASRLDDGITRIVEPYADPFIRCNIWHIRGRDRDLLIDSGLGIAPLRPTIEEVAGREPLALATHAHFDHVGGMYEFEERIIHPLEAHLLADPPYASIRVEDYPRALREMFPDAPQVGELVTAYPSDDFDASLYRVRPTQATRLAEEGDVIDLGDRTLEVLHLPGHTVGSIGLWEASTNILFTGDALYEGELLGHLPESDPHAYVSTMERLRSIPVSVVHAGHGESFGRERSIELIDAYLAASHA